MILVNPQVSLGQLLCSLRSELGRSTGFTRFRADFLPVLVKGSCEARRGTALGVKSTQGGTADGDPWRISFVFASVL